MHDLIDNGRWPSHSIDHRLRIVYTVIACAHRVGGEFSLRVGDKISACASITSCIDRSNVNGALLALAHRGKAGRKGREGERGEN